MKKLEHMEYGNRFFPQSETPVTASESLSQSAQTPEMSVVAQWTDTPVTPDTDTTVLPKSAILIGDISVDGNLKISGAVTGTINCTGNAKISGDVKGNVICGDIALERCTVRGDITASGIGEIGPGGGLLGNFQGRAMLVDGSVHGDIIAQTQVRISSIASITGNVTVARLLIEEGAALQGVVSVSSERIADWRISDD